MRLEKITLNILGVRAKTGQFDFLEDKKMRLIFGASLYFGQRYLVYYIH